ncbi:MAG: hypothetical protein HYX47_10385 [Burkholderiales bacterium]|nr:hypothetical protein [Burkholderiales bacterium]
MTQLDHKTRTHRILECLAGRDTPATCIELAGLVEKDRKNAVANVASSMSVLFVRRAVQRDESNGVPYLYTISAHGRALLAELLQRIELGQSNKLKREQSAAVPVADEDDPLLTVQIVRNRADAAQAPRGIANSVFTWASQL